MLSKPSIQCSSIHYTIPLIRQHSGQTNSGLNSKLTLKARANYMIEMRCLKPKWGLGRPEEDHNFITAAGLVV